MFQRTSWSGPPATKRGGGRTLVPRLYIFQNFSEPKIIIILQRSRTRNGKYIDQIRPSCHHCLRFKFKDDVCISQIEQYFSNYTNFMKRTDLTGIFIYNQSLIDKNLVLLGSFWITQMIGKSVIALRMILRD